MNISSDLPNETSEEPVWNTKCKPMLLQRQAFGLSPAMGVVLERSTYVHCMHAVPTRLDPGHLLLPIQHGLFSTQHEQLEGSNAFTLIRQNIGGCLRPSQELVLPMISDEEVYTPAKDAAIQLHHAQGMLFLYVACHDLNCQKLFEFFRIAIAFLDLTTLEQYM